MSTVHPSAAILVRSETPIGDCVRRMRENGVGSVLVQGDSFPHPIIGIFTERDLLNKIDELQHGGYWNRAVLSVMSKPVITIKLENIDQAPALMIKHRIRHLPVLDLDDSGVERLAGVISMRNLFQALVEGSSGGSGKVRSWRRMFRLGPKVEVYACLRSGETARLIRWAFAREKNILWTERTWKLVAAELKADSAFGNVSAVILDLDTVDSMEWVEMLKELNQKFSSIRVILLFDPSMQSEISLAALNKIGQSGQFSAFAKPLNVLDLLEETKNWQPRN